MLAGGHDLFPGFLSLFALCGLGALSSFHQHEHNVYVARRYTGYPACLGKGLGVDGLQFLSGLGGKLPHIGVVEPSFYLYVFESVHLFGHHSLSFHIAFVLCPYLYGFGYFLLSVGGRVQYFLKRRYQVGKYPDVKLRTADEIRQFASFAEWGGAEVFKRWVYVLRSYRSVFAEILNPLYVFLFFFPPVVTVSSCQSEAVCAFGQSCVGIVLTQQYAELGP